MAFGIVTAKQCFLYEQSGGPAGEESKVADEIFSGWAVRTAEDHPSSDAAVNEYNMAAENCETAANEHNTIAKKCNTDANNCVRDSHQDRWIQIETHYGYRGYVRVNEICWISEEELLRRQDKTRFFRIGAVQADLLSIPKVQGRLQEVLLKDSFVELLDREAAEGWSLIRTAAGHEGYVRSVYLQERLDDDRYLLGEALNDFQRLNRINRISGRGFSEDGFDKEEAVCRVKSSEKSDEVCTESELRRNLAESARSYLGTQYRWGGKSSQGTDCSGLVFMSYLENGILIFRDSRIHPDFPVHEIERDHLQMGDLIYFPGHVAMYLENGKYIHATAFAAQPGVVINSLNPQDPDYRADLAGKIVACGSVFVPCCQVLL